VKLSSQDYVVTEGHIDVFEITRRLRMGEEAPLQDSLMPRFLKGGIDVVFLPVGGDGVHHRDGAQRPLVGSLDVLDLFLHEVEKTDGSARIILSKEDLPSQPDPDHVYFLMELEGGRPFQEDYSSGKSMERKLALLRCFYRLGVRSVQLTHNGRNELGDGLNDRRTGGGLSEFGVAVIKEMNRLGMLVGVSHLSDPGFFDALEVSEAPIVATHSNARAVYDHARNLSDELLKALAENGGVAGMHFLGMMMSEFTMDHYLDHIEHVVEVTGSTKHVGIGYLGNDPPHLEVFPQKGRSVPKNDKYPQGMGYLQQHQALIQGLEARGYRQEEIADIMGGNYLRVLRQVLG
jgi:membrane dipeptidase